MYKKYWYLIISNLILKGILLFFLVLHILRNDSLWIFFTFCMIIIAFIPDMLRRYVKIDLPLLFDFFIALSLIFHVGNGLLDGSSFIDIYNKFTHFFSAIVVAFLSLLILYVIHEYEGDIVNNKKKVLFDIIVITVALGVVWELAEWSTDFLFGWGSQVNLDDTMLDLFADVLGACVMSLIGYGLIKRGVLQRIAENIKNQLDEMMD